MSGFVKGKWTGIRISAGDDEYAQGGEGGGAYEKEYDEYVEERNAAAEPPKAEVK